MEILLSILVLAIVGALIYWILTLIPLPDPPKTIIQVIFLVVFVIILLGYLFGYGPHPVFWHY
jgi:membrane-bound metal-dependent hydrolase YbcI (DUF457 family)